MFVLPMVQLLTTVAVTLNVVFPVPAQALNAEPPTTIATAAVKIFL
jgi:hypothetical protein